MSSQVDTNAYTTPFLATAKSHRDPYPAISPSKSENSQKGKIVIVTGGGAGIGAAAAKVWARAGASGIVIAARNAKSLQAVAQELNSINPDVVVLSVPTDITLEKDVQNLYDQVQNKFGRQADVLLNVAGYQEEAKKVGEQDVESWWRGFEVNLKGLYSMVHYFIKSQSNTEDPIGTIITVSSGLAGLTQPAGSGYSINKLGGQRFGEFLDAEYPNLRTFTTMPGIVATEMPPAAFLPYALDHVDLTGMLSLYLAQPRADFLRGSMVGVNWDVEELEEHKSEILAKGLFKTSWLPILPVGGGHGLGK